MEKRKDFIKAINYAKYIAFIAATICVFVFQFVAEPICITLALAFYVVAFGLMFTGLVIHCIEVYDADKLIKETKADLIEPHEADQEEALINATEKKMGDEVEVVNLKSEKIWSVIGAIFFGAFTIFTFIVLILY